MRTVLCAAFAYFAGVFLAGVALGSLRVLALEPAVGDPAATLIEAPLMLGISWAVCRAAIRRFAVGRGAAARLGMGLAAFALLIGAETIFGLFARDRSLAAQIEAYRQAGPAIGLAAQALFALFPWVQARLGPSPR